MKKIQLFVLLTTLTLMTGCGGGGGGQDTPPASTTSTNPTSTGNGGEPSGSTEIAMIKDRPYTINKGDRIVRKQEPTTIEVVADTEEKVTTATLKEGKAILKRH